MATYSDTINFLYTQLPMFSRMGQAAVKKDLTNIKALCAALGNPQEQFKSIHVAGTNGKGSVCHMLAAILQEAGYKTGLHTSPHLKDFRERIRVNGEMTPETFVINFVEENWELISDIQPSFFEISVAMAFQWFAINKVDVAIVEVGLGGRLDSTNILNPALSVITNISMDHVHILGDTLEQIAGEKAGIIKSQIPVVIGNTHPETVSVFKDKARKMKSPIYFADQLCSVSQKKIAPGQMTVCVKNEENANPESVYKMDLTGCYQADNLLTVVVAIGVLQQQGGWDIKDGHIQEGLSKVKKLTGMRGRWDVLCQNPMTIADVGHNPAGINQIMQQVRAMSYRHLYIVLGFVKDKEIEKALRFCIQTAEYLFCQADNPRSLSAVKLMEMASQVGLRGAVYPSVGAACEQARQKASEEDLILICGSTFIVAEALP